MSLSLQEQLSQVKEAIATWEEPEDKPAHQFKTTNGVTRAVFDCIKYNPGTTKSRAMHVLEVQGFKKASTSSIIATYIRQGTFVNKQGDVFLAPGVTEFVSAKPNRSKKEKTEIGRAHV